MGGALNFRGSLILSGPQCQLASFPGSTAQLLLRAKKSWVVEPGNEAKCQSQRESLVYYVLSLKSGIPRIRCILHGVWESDWIFWTTPHAEYMELVDPYANDEHAC